MTTLRMAMPFDSVTVHLGAPMRLRSGLSLSLPTCPNCGESMLAPEASEFVGPRQPLQVPPFKAEVRHSWTCDDCGHDFRTAIQIDGGRIEERHLG